MPNTNAVQSRREFLSGLADLPLVRQVTCDGCGACCMHMGGPPFCGMWTDPKYIHQADPEWLELRNTHPELADQARQAAIDGRGDAELPCVWLDLETKRCRNYEHRPSICRDFEMGSAECLKHRATRGIA